MISYNYIIFFENFMVMTLFQSDLVSSGLSKSLCFLLLILYFGNSWMLNDVS